MSLTPNHSRPLTTLRNRCFLRLLERIARRFNEAGVPLMVLKGAALNLLVPGTLTRRSMSDLDLLVRPQDIDAARDLLEGLQCLRGQQHVREDFFPRYHYEIEYHAQGVYPMKIDLHVWPFRPLRYARLMLEDALWEGAAEIACGEARVWVPGREDMLLHLAVHAAIHDFACTKWQDDIRLWIETFGPALDWTQLVRRADEWGVALPLRTALCRVARATGVSPPIETMNILAASPVAWRDRLALWQAPRDATHPFMHVLVNLLCTPGRRFRLGYLRAMALPDRLHMGEWYCRRHPGWLPFSHLLRWCWPAIRHLPRLWTWFSKIDVRPSRIHGVGVFATRDLKADELIARWHGRVVEQSGLYVGWTEASGEERRLIELSGRLQYLNHSCNPNAQLLRSTLVATRPIPAGEEITINYGGCTCHCEKEQQHCASAPPALPRQEAA